MTPLLRSAVFVAALSATLSKGLVAQSGQPDTPTNPACPLLTDQELDTATGLDYGPGEGINIGQGAFGGATCLWGGMGADPAKDLPQIGVVFIPPGSRGSHTEFYRGRKPEAGCTREMLRGIGDVAFVDSCEKARAGVRVYVKTGRNDVFLVVDQLQKRPLSWAQPVAVALAKAAAPRARNQ
ncbi:MAG TPA: hypothetical protein VFT84_08115 [Gemmatimonadales bacterium]|nr:hypothetical protein [Gemmatimonadales bacterium]